MSSVHHLLTSASHLSVTGRSAVVAMVVVGVLGVVGLASAVGRMSLRAVAIVAAAGCAATVGAVVVLWAAYRPLPVQMSGRDAMVVSVALSAVFAAVAVAARGPGRRRAIAAVLAASALWVSAAGVVNRDVGRYPTVGALAGHRPPPTARLADFDQVPGPQSRVQIGSPTAAAWQPPMRHTPDGMLTHAEIPGTASGFTARPALVYLPPAYLDSPRPLLPVLVLVAGNPGQPDDWLGNGLAETVSAFAAAHDGLAPVVVVPDALGATDAVPLCLDSRLGNVDTYLAVDVPAWVASHLQVDGAPQARAIGGYSYGGTCAVQLSTNHPDVYPTFLDMSGQDEPSLGDHAATVAATFGGDESAFAAVSAREVLIRHPRTGVSGVFVVGAEDDEYRPQQRRMYDAARAAGMQVRYYELQGGHSGQVWGPGLAGELDWLARRTGLLAP
ncbi:alpha/beta hydrolase [Rhodococcus sp. NPDC127528]|uniref:alpha/beta hydrolase n=1 Tax=unclassified Rhodococcus (in: high G+C Gram-positive bacteria) TaxID=192944 RepID=UPI003624C03D